MTPPRPSRLEVESVIHRVSLSCGCVYDRVLSDKKVRTYLCDHHARYPEEIAYAAGKAFDEPTKRIINI